MDGYANDGHCNAHRASGGRAIAPHRSWHNRPVDFARTFRDIETELACRQIRVAVVGGIALAAYGHPRSTLDLDLVVDGDRQPQVIDVLAAQGFETLHQSTGYSNHLHPDPTRGRVDVLYVRDRTRDSIFAGLRLLPGPGEAPIPVPRPEHLIAMKVHAIRHAPARLWQDMADIAHLVRLDGVDREEVRGYFVRAGLEDKWRELEAHL
jgi:hypothetical protein